MQAVTQQRKHAQHCTAMTRQTHRICGPICSAFLQGGHQVLRCGMGLPHGSQSLGRILKRGIAQIPWHILHLLTHVFFSSPLHTLFPVRPRRAAMLTAQSTLLVDR